MPLSYKPAAQSVKPGQIPSPGNNSFLGDVFTSDAPDDKKITCGFYRQEAGEPLVYTYTYDEMKIVLEVEGEFTITDETGTKVIASPGDVLFFPKGTTITFATTGYALNFFTGLRPKDGA
ncbi:eutQ Acetate kinase EutQ [Candida maltosa Xu316]|uniref:Ethanolamine utilization protein n=1 Tax=Candida maltosa (strain Xu316) TaxID=1245528 RepID=M3JDE4_CANMX|nr:hypothetical protein G210_4783 [Candida maltosa Xu316]